MSPIYYHKKHKSVHGDRRYKYLVRQNSVSTQRPSIETVKFNGWYNENPDINPTVVTRSRPAPSGPAGGSAPGFFVLNTEGSSFTT